MERNDYKPLTDEELTRDEAYVISLRDRGSPYSFKSQYGVLQLLEQARRANAAMKALRDYNSGTLPWSKVMEVVEAYDGND